MVGFLVYIISCFLLMKYYEMNMSGFIISYLIKLVCEFSMYSYFIFKRNEI